MDSFINHNNDAIVRIPIMDEILWIPRENAYIINQKKNNHNYHKQPPGKPLVPYF